MVSGARSPAFKGVFTVLVLGRRKNESIRIGNDIKLTVVSVSSGSVKIAIEAPGDMSIHREEIWLKIQEQNDEKQ